MRLKSFTPILAALLFYTVTLQPAFAQVSGLWASLNWAGYVAEGGGYTSVTGTWTIASVSPASTIEGDAQWVGIGGMGSSDLIQAGTQAYVHDNTVDYFAWFEMLPQYSISVPLYVQPGDSITTRISERGVDSWNVLIRDNTTGQVYDQDVTYHSQHLSAEWVEEMVSNTNGTLRPIDDFGTTSFTQGFATQNDSQRAIGGLDTRIFTMHDPNGTVLAQPSDLSQDGAGFTVSRQGAYSGPVQTIPVYDVQPQTQPIAQQSPAPVQRQPAPVRSQPAPATPAPHDYVVPDPFAPKTPTVTLPSPFGQWSWSGGPTSTVTVSVITPKMTVTTKPVANVPVASVTLKKLATKPITKRPALVKRIALKPARHY